MNIEKIETNEIVNKSNISKKEKHMLYFMETLISIGIIGFLVPMIVDISINRNLTWSLISGISIAFAYSGLIAFFVIKKDKCIKALAVYSILLIPYLFGLESIIDHYYLNPSQNRFMEYALPISCLWLAIIWGDILVCKIFRLNVLFGISILFVLAIAGTSLTNAIAYKISWAATFDIFHQKVEVLEFAACAIFFFVLGAFRKMNRRVIINN